MSTQQRVAVETMLRDGPLDPAAERSPARSKARECLVATRIPTTQTITIR